MLFGILNLSRHSLLNIIDVVFVHDSRNVSLISLKVILHPVV